MADKYQLGGIFMGSSKHTIVEHSTVDLLWDTDVSFSKCST